MRDDYLIDDLNRWRRVLTRLASDGQRHDADFEISGQRFRFVWLAGAEENHAKLQAIVEVVQWAFDELEPAEQAELCEWIHAWRTPIMIGPASPVLVDEDEPAEWDADYSVLALHECLAAAEPTLDQRQAVVSALRRWVWESQRDLLDDGANS